MWYAIDTLGGAGTSVRIEVRDSGSSALLGSWVDTDPTVGWETYTFTADPILGADVSFAFYVNSAIGNPVNGFFDMSAVPEAKGWMMGGALVGILGASSLLRRRQAKATA
jgi:hypothetical protein